MYESIINKLNFIIMDDKFLVIHLRYRVYSGILKPGYYVVADFATKEEAYQCADTCRKSPLEPGDTLLYEGERDEYRVAKILD